MQTWARAAGAVALGPVNLLGPSGGRTAMVYRHGLNLGLNCGTLGVRCPADLV